MNLKRVLGFVALGIAASVATANTSRSNLVGLQGVGVVAEIQERGERNRVHKDDIRNLVELRLRKVGIRVLTQDEFLADERSPYLYVNFNIVQFEDANPRVGKLPLTIYSIHLGLLQRVWIAADPVIRAEGVETWGESLLSATGDNYFKETVRRDLGVLVDRFLSDYLAANPRPQQVPK